MDTEELKESLEKQMALLHFKKQHLEYVGFPFKSDSIQNILNDMIDIEEEADKSGIKLRKLTILDIREAAEELKVLFGMECSFEIQNPSTGPNNL